MVDAWTVWQSVSIVALFICGFVGGLLAKFSERHKFVTQALNLAAAGVLLAAGSIHLLPDSSRGLEDLHGLGGYPLAPLLAYSTFILLLLTHMLAEYFAVYTMREQPTESTELVDTRSNEANVGAALSMQLSSSSPRHWAAAIVLLVALGFHAFVAGMSLGGQKEVKDVVDILGPIVAHKTLAAVALGSSIVKANAPNHVFYTLITLFSLTTPIGVVVGLVIAHYSDNQVWAAACQSLAAGTFIYVAVYEIMPDSLTVKNGLIRLIIQFICLILGFGLMAMLGVWV